METLFATLIYFCATQSHSLCWRRQRMCPAILEFRLITQAAAKDACSKWHYAPLNRGQDFYGVEYEGRIIAAAVFDNGRYDRPRIIEFMACAKDPTINNRILQMSQLMAYSCRQLKARYDLVISYAERGRAIGGIFKGASWYYSGAGDLYHEYWWPLSKAGRGIACDMGLKQLEYPK